MFRKLSLLLACSFLAACNAAQSGLLDRKQELVLQGPDAEISLQVELADSEEERRAGLMFRESLDTDSGMLFVFDDTEVRYFWMKNTLIPLDVLFFDDERKWISTASMQPCKEEVCISYSSNGPARYALEVPLGWAAEHDVGPGWSLLPL